MDNNVASCLTDNYLLFKKNSQIQSECNFKVVNDYLSLVFCSPSNLTVYGEEVVKRLEKIGRGSFWKVYRGTFSDNCCAIKKLRGTKKSGNQESLIQKIMKELDMWSSLNHPNILRLYGIYYEEEEVDSTPSLIVELLDRSLTDHVNATFNPRYRESLFPLKTKIFILSQVARALEYLHTLKSVVHGDLTANNVLLKEISIGSFKAKLTDFGMSRVLNEQDNIMSSVQGTYSYMPPEVHNGGQTSTKVDIYSFGVLCVHILSHKFPKPLYALRVNQEGTHIVVSEFNRFSPYLLELADDERLLEPLIEECLQYEPEDRLCAVGVIGQLDSVQRSLDLNERRPNSPNQTRQVVHQHFNGPVVSGCNITESNLNVQSVTDCNMNVSTVAEITPLTGPLERVPQLTSRDNHPASGHHPRSAALEDIPEV